MITNNFTWQSDSILSRMKSSLSDFNDYFRWQRHDNNDSIDNSVPIIFENKFLTVDEIFKVNNTKFRFEYIVIFKHIDFKDTSIFQYIEFIKDVKFENCKFINFESLSFRNFEFVDCEFEEECSLVDRGSTHLSHFCSCKFNGNLKFSEFRLHTINFKDCKFTGDINSRNVDFIEVKFSNCEFVNFEVLNTKPNYHAGNETINYKLPIFELCRFSGNFIATKCFIDDCFLACNFEKIPFFNGSTEGSFQNFDSIQIETSVTNIKQSFSINELRILPNKIRALKKLTSANLHNSLESKLNILERNIERSIFFNEFKQKKKINLLPKYIDNLFKAFFDKLYWASSDYGKSPAIVVIWWIVSFIAIKEIYYFLFRDIARSSIKNATLTQDEFEKFNRIVDNIAIANHIPIVGNLSIEPTAKQFVYCGGIITPHQLCLPPLGYEPLMIFQNLFSGILIFLFGLAIRNYFKIK